MASSITPTCNVTVMLPAANPSAPRGFRLLPPNATLQDVIKAFNNNFSPQTQDEEFSRRLGMDISGFGNRSVQARGSGQQGQGQGQGQQQRQPQQQPKPKQGQIPKAIDDKLKNMRFKQVSVARKKIKVTNPQDKEQWIIDDRVTNLVMRDKSGATWTWNDVRSADANSGTNTETTKSSG